MLPIPGAAGGRKARGLERAGLWLSGHTGGTYAQAASYCRCSDRVPVDAGPPHHLVGRRARLLRTGGDAPRHRHRAGRDRPGGQPRCTLVLGWLVPLLYTEYGIPGLPSAHRIVALNDAAGSQAEAAGLILIRLSTSCDMARLLPPD